MLAIWSGGGNFDSGLGVIVGSPSSAKAPGIAHGLPPATSSKASKNEALVGAFSTGGIDDWSGGGEMDDADGGDWGD